MKIDSVDLQNFRNYRSLHLSFGPGVHVFYGDNAQGKTNLLEAVYLSLTGRSYRNAKDREMIAFSEEEAHVKSFVSKADMSYRVDMHLKKGRNRGIALNGVPIRKMKEFAGTFHAVVFSPEDLQIVKNGPEVRRKFMDTELSMTDPVYFNAFFQYKKALEQRNQLLKEIGSDESLLDTLFSWDEMIVRYGRVLIRERQKFLSEIGPIVEEIHRVLTGRKEAVLISYEMNVTEENFEKALSDARNRDLKAKTTTVGPHRDDIAFQIVSESGAVPIDARIYGSQGQQRTSALALKLSEIKFLQKKMGENPVLLLDDVFSELDSSRQQYLVDYMQELQTFITCTGLEDFVDRQSMKISSFRISNGVVING